MRVELARLAGAGPGDFIDAVAEKLRGKLYA